MSVREYCEMKFYLTESPGLAYTLLLVNTQEGLRGPDLAASAFF